MKKITHFILKKNKLIIIYTFFHNLIFYLGTIKLIAFGSIETLKLPEPINSPSA